MRLLLTGAQRSPDLARCCLELRAVWHRLHEALNPLLQDGMYCPRMAELQPVFLFANADFQSGETWLQSRWNVSTQSEARLHVDAWWADLNSPQELLKALNRGTSSQVRSSVAFLCQNATGLHAFPNAYRHFPCEPFGFTLPGPDIGRWVTVFLVPVHFETVSAFVLCYEIDAIWAPTPSESPDDSDFDDAEVIASSDSEGSFAREAATVGPFLISDTE